MLTPPGTGPGYRERILVIGGFGTGKSTGWLNIAQWAQRTETDSQFYVIDSDDSVQTMIARSGPYKALDNLTFFPAHEWQDYSNSLDLILQKARAQDWVVVDFVGSAWDAVQEWYVEQIFGRTDMGQFFLEARQAKKKSALDGWKDWSIINRVYRTWANKLFYDLDAHTYVTAVSDPVRETDDKEVKQLFASYGVRPRGQKHLAHAVHTVLLAQTDGRGSYFMNSVKDRERELLTGVEVTDFVLTYLSGVAGWTL